MDGGLRAREPCKGASYVECPKEGSYRGLYTVRALQGALCRGSAGAPGSGGTRTPNPPRCWTEHDTNTVRARQRRPAKRPPREGGEIRLSAAASGMFQ